MPTITKAPTKEDVDFAKAFSGRLAGHLSSEHKLSEHEKRCSILINHEKLELPSAIVQLLANILSEMAVGNAVTVTPIHAELSTQQAADLLNVSRPYLIKLLEGSVIPFRLVGKHRRVSSKDLLKYKNDIDSKRGESLDELAEQAQELDMGY